MSKPASVTLKVVAGSDFAAFGDSVIAYIRKIEEEDGKTAFAYYGANGKRLGIEQSENDAIHAIQRMNLFPVVLQ